MEWTEYNWDLPHTRPPKSGRYIIERKSGHIQFEQWNGSGWAYSNGDCLRWMEIPKGLGKEPKEMENHLYIENKITGQKEYVISFDGQIIISKGSVIQSDTFKLSVS